MNLSKQNILFFPRTMGLGGTENVVLQLCEILKPLVKNIVVCSCGGENVKRLKALGIHHYMIPDIGSKSPIVMLKTAKILCKIVREKNITVIHTHHRMAAFYAAVLKLWKECVFINTSHNTFADKRVLTAFAYQHAHVIACGEMVKQNLTDVYRMPRDSVMVIRNAVQAFDGHSVVDETVQAWHDGGYFVVGNVGRLSEQKGMEYYLKAIPMIVKRHPETRFMVIGTGTDEEKLRILAEKLSIKPYVHFMGYRADVQNLMSQLDLVVLSSLWEGMPLTPLEAFSVKKTVVATAVDGTVEIIRDGKNGYLIPPRDPEAIAEKVIDLIEHPDRRHDMEENGYQTFLTEFSYDAFSQKVLDFYRSL